MESRIIPERGFEYSGIDVRGIRGKGIIKFLLAPFMILKALVQSIAIMRRIRPGVVLGLGGFVSGPGGAAAWLLGIPLVIHEQNSVAGLTNRMLAPLATIVMEGFPGVFKSAKSCFTGNPVRSDIAAILPPEVRLKQHDQGCLRVLILGGSQGAKIFNEILPPLCRLLVDDIELRILHQTGGRHLENTRAAYADSGCIERVEVVPFIDDMATAYEWADIVICRAGALTLSELCIAGIASILVPYPHAVDDHQTVNAQHLVNRGGAILIPEAKLDLQDLAGFLREICQFRERLIEMARKAREMAKPDATRAVADICLEMVNA
jgi:UDP-N-acetylglucosamine--N-acetylmuramyl-(pentapeptide) pyrophosphoryl-undecaprenol N-acetylglucosamine transferase